MPKGHHEGLFPKILVDTNVWILFFRGNPEACELSNFLFENKVVTHPWVIGEMMLGTLGSRREKILADLALLPSVSTLEPKEVFDFIREHKLYGKGLSFVDVYLLASSKAEKIPLWTFDKKLHSEAKKLGCVFDPL